MKQSQFDSRIKDYSRIALVLQGGGALGSYQAGVYEGLASAGIHPNWVAGISIGALNSAIIAGNPPERRVERLHEFWDTICKPVMLPLPWAPMLPSNAGRDWSVRSWSVFEEFSGETLPGIEVYESVTQTIMGSMAAASAVMQGQSGFFHPRVMAPGGGSPDQTSFYDTTPMLETLERFADFDRINSGETRVSLGATNVATGNFVYFDNAHMKLTPKHFLASGSLPPGFPATEIDGQYYWDGGCVSNTPLDYVLSQTPRRDTLVFQVDLWSAQGDLPRDIFQVQERLKDIQYSSRTRAVTNTIHMVQQMRKALIDTVARIPKEVKEKDPWFDEMVRHMMGARFNVIHLIYRNKSSEGHYKDYQFSNETMQMHWQTGLKDMQETLSFPECLDIPAEGENFVTFDIHTHSRMSSQTMRSSSMEFGVSDVSRGPGKAARKQVAGSKSVKPSGSRRQPRQGRA